MSRKKVVLSINASWNIVNFRLGLIRALQRQGYKVAALAPPDRHSGASPRLSRNSTAIRDSTLLTMARRVLRPAVMA